MTAKAVKAMGTTATAVHPLDKPLSDIESHIGKPQKKGYTLDTNGYLVEVVEDIDLLLPHGVTFSFQVPIIINA